MEARLRNLNYSAPIMLEFTIVEDGIEREPEKVHIGDLPVMIKSKKCNLHKDNIEMDREPTAEELDKFLVKMGEDLCDPGGYFIIGGTERALISLEDLAPNRVMVELNERYGTSLHVAKVFSQKEGYRALTLMEKKKDGMLVVSVPAASGQIPLIVLMKALGMESDEEIFKAIVSDPQMANIVYANIEECQNKKLYPPNGIYTTEDAILFLERKFATGQAKEYRAKKVESIIDRSLLPHLGDTAEARMKKSIFLGRVARTILELELGKRKEDDKDHYANKRLKLAGDLMEDLFRVAFTNLIKDLKYQLERGYTRKKGLRISSAIRPDLLTHRLLHAFATGNWVGGRAGVSQLLDRTSNMSALSHLRRVTSPLTRSQPHFEARDLHPTQWGRLCPNETPEGQNCGLVKNCALIVDVSEGTDDKDVIWLLRDLGVKEVSEQQTTETRVYVNGDLIGLHDKPKELVEEIRQRRRSGLLSSEVNVRFDDNMNEIIINCDEGRLRRPLLVVRHGKTLMNHRHVEDMRSKKAKWADLIREGVVEWIDAEEEEDSYIAGSAYMAPQKCDHCGKLLSETDVDWRNPGEEGKVVLECKSCGGTMQVESLSQGRAHACRDRPHGHPGRLLGAGAVPGAQLQPEGHDGLRHGEAVARTQLVQLQGEAGHQEPRDALPAEAPDDHEADGVRGVRPEARGPELRGRDHVVPGIQHGGRDSHEQVLRGARPRPLGVHEDVQRGGAQVPRRPGGPLRDTEPRRQGREGRPVLQQPGRGRPHQPRDEGRGWGRAHRQDLSPEVPRGGGGLPDAPEEARDIRDRQAGREGLGRLRHADGVRERLQARQGQGQGREDPGAGGQVRLQARAEGCRRSAGPAGGHAVHGGRPDPGPHNQPARHPVAYDRRPRARDDRGQGRLDGGQVHRRDRLQRREGGGAQGRPHQERLQAER